MFAEIRHGLMGNVDLARQLDAPAVHSSVLYTTTELPHKVT